MSEKWKPVERFEGHYEVSSLGRVRSLDRILTQKNGRKRFHKGRIIKPRKINSGYYKVTLSANRRQESPTVHRLVLVTFKGQPPSKEYQVNHIDGDKTNNRADNLEWATPAENH